MTNKEKFIEVFGEEPQRQYATKSWWEQEYIMQEKSVLDKIRAEIEASKWTDNTRLVRNALASGLDKALEIIDKYKSESEDKE